MRHLSVVAVAALLCSTAAHAEWQRATSTHFVVYDNDAPERVKAFTERLETFDKAMRVWHGAKEDVRGPSARVTVFVVDNVNAIQKLSGSSEIAGFYNPRAGASVAFTPRSTGQGSTYGFTSQAVLFHEYTHHWMLTNWTDAALPAWFVEGFAELHATAIFRDGNVIFGAQPRYRQWTVGDPNLLPMNELLSANPGRLNGASHDALYSRGWLLTDYLTFDDQRRGQLAAYIGALNSGKPVADANSLLGNVSSLDLKLNSWGQKTVRSALIPADKLAINPVAVNALTPGEAAMMLAYIASKRGVGVKQAPKVVAAARTAAAPFPNDAFAQNELAEAEFDACDVVDKVASSCFAASETASDRALAADPKSMHALLYKGYALAAAAKADKVTDQARWSAIRRWYLTANKANPEEPEPLIAFYDSFKAADQVPTKNADTGLLYAYALAPYDGNLRYRATEVYLRQGNVAAAKIAIGPVAYNFEDPTAAERARKVLDAINSGGAAAGLAELQKKPEKKAGDDS